jgi:hypothetical protein
MRPRSPEVRNRGANSLIVLLRICIHISGICNLPLGRRIDTVDLGRCEGLECWKVEGLTQSIDTSVLEKLVARLVNCWGMGVLLKLAGAADSAREIVSRV